jgi:multidrug efflux pump subunit AcrA (membrane-fusion protein)
MLISLRTAMLIAASAGASCLLTACHQTTTVAAEKPTVPTATAEPANLANELVLTAKFTPYQNVDVMAKVAGYVKNIYVDIGDRVHEGNVLATLEVPELQSDMAKATAGVAAAQVNIITARAMVHSSRGKPKHCPSLLPANSGCLGEAAWPGPQAGG